MRLRPSPTSGPSAFGRRGDAAPLSEEAACDTLWLILALVVPALADAPADVLDKAPSKFAKSGENKVHYKSLGDGKTAVVFIHGWCCDHTVWRDQAVAFDGKGRLLFVDLPGYGKSDKPKIDYTMDVFANGIDAVLKDAGVEKAVLSAQHGHPGRPPVLPAVPGQDAGGSCSWMVRYSSSVGPGRHREVPVDVQGRNVQRNARPDVRHHVPFGHAGGGPRRSRAGRRRERAVAISSMRHGRPEDLEGGPDQGAGPGPDGQVAVLDRLNTRRCQEAGAGWTTGVRRRRHFLFLEKTKEFNEALGEFLKKAGGGEVGGRMTNDERAIRELIATWMRASSAGDTPRC